MIEIESNMPMPSPDHGGHQPKYPWKTLEVGQSFVIAKTGNYAHVLAYQACQRYAPKRFKARKIGHNSYRIWRMS